MKNSARTDSVYVYGGVPLQGRISIQGSKNAALPIIASTILVKGNVTLTNVPDLSDIRVMLEILKHLGAEYSFENGVIRLNCENLENKIIPDDFSNKLRASSLTLGPLLARFGECQVGMPGGCVIGNRPLDIHFKGFETLGAEVNRQNGFIHAKATKLGGEFTLSFPSVGATQNLISAAALGSGEIILHNVAREPEIQNMIDFLNAAGAKIKFKEGAPATLIIQGVESLGNVKYAIQPDRIEAATFLTAGLATKGNIELVNVNVEDIHLMLQILSEMGAGITTGENRVSIKYQGPFQGTKIRTAVYPGFPTDAQPQMGVLLTQASTPSVVVEDIFNNRLRYCDELNKMNGNIKIEGNVAFIEPSQLSGCRVDSFDLRAAAAMIMAGLVAQGVTRVTSLKYLYRGYEAYVEKLQYLGAEIGYFK